MAEPKRKGSRSIKEIPQHILEQLNCGEMESANLVDFLGVDRKILLENVIAQYDRKKYLQAIVEPIDLLEKKTANTIDQVIGIGLFRQVSVNNDNEFFEAVVKHPSDIVRCWATCMIGNTETTIEDKLQKIKPFAMDKHFNVRECAWADVRKSIVQNLYESLVILSKWSQDENENIRRFTSEATRPRGVWCEHINILKQNPALGLPILETLKSDNAKYVRDSVGNWLNDASKTQPQFIKELWSRWEIESNTAETKYIIKKALRTINK